MVGVVAAIAIWPHKQFAGEKPEPFEITLGTLGHSTPSLLFGLIGIIVYGVIFAAIFWLPTLFGFDTRKFAEPIALGISAVMVAPLLSGVTFVDAPEFLRKLYPLKAGEKSPYSVLRLQRAHTGWKVAAGAIALLLVASLPFLPYGSFFPYADSLGPVCY